MTTLMQDYLQVMVPWPLLANSGGLAAECLGTGSLGAYQLHDQVWFARPAVSWRMKGNHQANPNQISQASIWPAQFRLPYLILSWRAGDGGKISSHLAFALGVHTAASPFVS